MSVKKGIKLHGTIARDAVAKEFVNLFVEKKALLPVDSRKLTKEQRSKLLRSHMFLKEKRDGKGAFKKMKGRVVAYGRARDRTLYQQLESPTASIKSIFI